MYKDMLYRKFPSERSFISGLLLQASTYSILYFFFFITYSLYFLPQATILGITFIAKEKAC